MSVDHRRLVRAARDRADLVERSARRVAAVARAAVRSEDEQALSPSAPRSPR